MLIGSNCFCARCCRSLLLHGVGLCERFERTFPRAPRNGAARRSSSGLAAIQFRAVSHCARGGTSTRSHCGVCQQLTTIQILREIRAAPSRKRPKFATLYGPRQDQLVLRMATIKSAATWKGCHGGIGRIHLAFAGSHRRTALVSRGRGKCARACCLPHCIGALCCYRDWRGLGLGRTLGTEPSLRSSPLVIYGPCGAGKTFLAEGLAECWRQASAPELSSKRHVNSSRPAGIGREVLQLSGIDFARQYADACDTNSMSDFRESLARPGVLLIDAVHTIVEKPRATRELCYQLDQWNAVGKLVLFTSLVAPAALGNAGLASRLSAGLVVPLALPALETRRQLLAHFAARKVPSVS